MDYCYKYKFEYDMNGEKKEYNCIANSKGEAWEIFSEFLCMETYSKIIEEDIFTS